MKWQAKEDTDKYYGPGELKVVKYFPLLPKKIGGNWWWLESVYVTYKCIPRWESNYARAYEKMKAGKDFDESALTDREINWTYVGTYSKVEYFVEKL